MKPLVMVFFAFQICANITQSNAQWVQTSFPHDTTVYSLVVKGSIIFAGTSYAGLFKSSNNGITWIQMNTGIPTSSEVFVLYVLGNDILAGTSSGLFRSTNDGASWSPINNGLSSHSVLAIAVAWAGSLWVGTNAGIFTSTNNGQSWNIVPSLLPYDFSAFVFPAIAFNGTYLFVGGRDWRDMTAQVFRFSNYGLTVEVLHDTTEFFGESISSICTDANKIYLGTSRGALYSSNNGNSNTWSSYKNSADRMFSLIHYGSSFFAGAYEVLTTNDTLSSWAWTGVGFPVAPVRSLAVKDTNLFAGTNTHGIWKRSIIPFVPIELKSFGARMSGGRILLKWDTESETNNHGFEIQRRFEQHSDWTTIGFVSGSGTTQSNHSYSYEDPLSSLPSKSGIVQYRLKQIDSDGSSALSPVVEVTLEMQENDLKLSCTYPNPASAQTTISYSIKESGHVNLRIRNILGEVFETLVDADQSAGTYSEFWNVTTVKSGAYICELSLNGKAVRRNMVVAK